MWSRSNHWQNCSMENTSSVAMGPAQAAQVVEHRFRQIAVLVVLHDGNGAMALGQLLAVVAQDHGKVGVLGHAGAQGLQQH